MTTFADHQHPRATESRFAAKDHPEAELELGAPAITLSEATGDWGPSFHDMDSRPAYDDTSTERAAAAFRAQFGAAPDTEVDGGTAPTSVDSLTCPTGSQLITQSLQLLLTVPELRPDLPGGDGVQSDGVRELLLNSLCAFDLWQCVGASPSRQEGWGSAYYPSFASFQQHRLDPALQLMLRDRVAERRRAGSAQQRVLQLGPHLQPDDQGDDRPSPARRLSRRARHLRASPRSSLGSRRDK